MRSGSGMPAREDVAAEPLARHQLRRGLAHGVEALQPEGKKLGELFAGRLAVARPARRAEAASI